jgi:hypothetical protein
MLFRFHIKNVNIGLYRVKQALRQPRMRECRSDRGAPPYFSVEAKPSASHGVPDARESARGRNETSA